MTADTKARCEDCGLTYEVGAHGVPATDESYTCDDCGGYVDVIEPEDTVTTREDNR